MVHENEWVNKRGEEKRREEKKGEGEKRERQRERVREWERRGKGNHYQAIQ